MPLLPKLRPLSFFQFLDTFEYRKCLETEERTKSLENNDSFKGFSCFPVSRHFESRNRGCLLRFRELQNVHCTAFVHSRKQGL